MLRRTNNTPLDYSLCDMTVTVYHREGLTREVIENAYYEFSDKQATEGGIVRSDRNFLLIVPGQRDLRCGDKLVLGVGPDAPWDTLHIPGIRTLGIIETVKPRYFRGKICHMEARGDGL